MSGGDGDVEQVEFRRSDTGVNSRADWKTVSRFAVGMSEPSSATERPSSMDPR
jgi:hypothetical protein